MTTTVDRRRVLAGAVLGGAALAGGTALGSLAPEAAFGAADGIAPGAPDPNFAEGRVTSIAGSLVYATGSDGVLHRIQATNATSVWKLTPTTFDRIAVRDGCYARGLRLADGTLAADAIWVNIVNLHGHIAAMGRNLLHLDHRGQRIVAHVVPGTSAAVYNGTAPVTDMSSLRIGAHVQVIGAWHPDTNEIDVATVYAAA